MRMKIGYFHDNDRGLFKGFRPRESGGVGTVDTRPVLGVRGRHFAGMTKGIFRGITGLALPARWAQARTLLVQRGLG